MESDPRLKEAEAKLRANWSEPVVERAMRLIRVPATEWTDEERVFMDRVLADTKRKEETKQGLGCWILLLLLVSGIVAFLTRK